MDQHDPAPPERQHLVQMPARDDVRHLLELLSDLPGVTKQPECDREGEDDLVAVRFRTASGEHEVGVRVLDRGALLSIDDSPALEWDEDEWRGAVEDVLVALGRGELEILEAGGVLRAIRTGSAEWVLPHSSLSSVLSRGRWTLL